MTLESVNGPLAAEVAGDVYARAQTSPISVTGETGQGGGLDAENTQRPDHVDSGRPSQLETGTQNGLLSSDIPLSVMCAHVMRLISATLGRGGAPIRLVTPMAPSRFGGRPRAHSGLKKLPSRVAIPSRSAIFDQAARPTIDWLRSTHLRSELQDQARNRLAAPADRGRPGAGSSRAG
jgi:hypothetical protein